MLLLRVSASCDFAEARDFVAVEHVGAAGRAIEHAHHVEQGRFAAARRPHDRDELAVGDVEVDAVERGRLDRVGAVGLGEASHGQHECVPFLLAGAEGQPVLVDQPAVGRGDHALAGLEPARAPR